MRVILHPEFYRDARAIVEHYQHVADPELASEFRRALDVCIDRAAASPESFAIHENGLRRGNLRRFPYHLLFRIVGDTVQILVVRHHRRHPSFGIERR